MSSSRSVSLFGREWVRAEDQGWSTSSLVFIAATASAVAITAAVFFLRREPPSNSLDEVASFTTADTEQRRKQITNDWVRVHSRERFNQPDTTPKPPRQAVDSAGTGNTQRSTATVQTFRTRRTDDSHSSWDDCSNNTFDPDEVITLDGTPRTPRTTSTNTSTEP